MKDHVERVPSTPRVLIYDIETAPNIGYTWGKWQQNVMQFVSQKYILCFAWKWADEDEVHILGLTDFPREYKRNRKDDYRVVKKLHELFEEADVLVAHNGNSFDQKETQARFLFHGLPRTTPYAQVDTKLVAKRQFRLNSNSLNDIAGYLGLGKKLPHTGFDMWQRIIEDQDPEAWQTMRDYNVQDVFLLQEVYDVFRYNGWITNHPNLANISGDLENCPSCHAPKSQLQKRGLRHTQTVTYQRYQCQTCKTYHRERKSGTGPRFNN